MAVHVTLETNFFDFCLTCFTFVVILTVNFDDCVAGCELLNARFGFSSVPALGIYSTGDVALTEKQMVDSEKYMRGGWEYVRIEDSTHWIPLDQPERLSNEIVGWWLRI